MASVNGHRKGMSGLAYFRLFACFAGNSGKGSKIEREHGQGKRSRKGGIHRARLAELA